MKSMADNYRYLAGAVCWRFMGSVHSAANERAAIYALYGEAGF